jgi:2-oxoglutarate ferredoxin oxidoreductase subunit alpha
MSHLRRNQRPVCKKLINISFQIGGNMVEDLNIVVGGEAGQGVQSVGSVLAKSLLRGGYEIFADQDFESRIRGGHSFTRIRVNKKSVSSAIEPIDILVALNGETINLHRAQVRSGGVVLYDGLKTGIKINDGLIALDIPIEHRSCRSRAGVARL